MLFYRFVNKTIVKQPHRLVPMLVFVMAMLSFLYNPFSPFYTFALADPADYMRLNETVNWLQWQGWYDLSHPRLGPGAHTIIHSSRLIDMPLALIMWPAIKAWGYRSAGVLAALAEPLILLGLLLALVPAIARPLVGRGRAKLATLFVPFAPMLFFNFTPGRVAYHNWEILIAGIGLMALPRMLLCRKGWKAGIISAAAFAVGLWISPEVLPFLVLALGCLVLFASLRGGFALRNAAVFGVALVIATAALLPAALSVSEWHDYSVAWFSGGYVIFAALSGAVLVAAWLLGRCTENKILRLALVVALAGFTAIAFLYLVPDALISSFADYNGFNIAPFLENIGETQPLLKAFDLGVIDHVTMASAIVCFLQYSLPALLALIACVFVALRKNNRMRVIATSYGICLGGVFVLAVFVQSRFLIFAQMFQIAPLAYLTWSLWPKAGIQWTTKYRRRVVFIAFVILGILPGFAASFVAQLFFGSVQTASACFLKPAADYIAGPWGYTSRAYMILSGTNEGPELLFRSPHNIIGANFNLPANQDIFDFFNARDEKTPMNILRKWNVDLVLACRNPQPFYAGFEHPQIGTAHSSDNEINQPLLEKLVNGQPPDWLKAVEIPPSRDYLLFEVHLPEAKAKPPEAKK